MAQNTKEINMSYSIAVSARGCLGIKFLQKDIPNQFHLVKGCGHMVREGSDCLECDNAVIWPEGREKLSHVEIFKRASDVGYLVDVVDDLEWYIGKVFEEGRYTLTETETFVHTVSDLFSDITHESGLFIYLDQEDY